MLRETGLAMHGYGLNLNFPRFCYGLHVVCIVWSVGWEVAFGGCMLEREEGTFKSCLLL